MYHRMLVPDLLPTHIDRVIYLDADLLFLDDIEHLWCADISGSVVGAVQDAVIPHVSSPLGLSRFRALGFDRRDPYFNAGVLVVDLHAWRQHRVRDRAVDYAQRHRRSINMADQDVLNAVLHGRWTQLDDRWNIIGGAVGRAHFRARGIAPSRITTALRDPAIIHFAGFLKPWQYLGLGSRWANAYVDALREVFPGYRFDHTPAALIVAFYDRHLRTVLYPVERLAWRASRHLS
jgi:UDP-glucose/galactose:(glucosyl)LPS alpha-1,2-glucosyl/galactosyltransferase